MNIVNKLYSGADRSAPALVCEGRTVLYGELLDRAEAVAARLRECHATRVGLDCPNGIAHVVFALGIVRAGKCLVPIASELTAPERERLVSESGVGAILDAKGTLRELPVDVDFKEEELAALNPAFIRFSSGTTGRSKGVVLSHERLLERVTAANRVLQIGPGDRVVWILPMAHHFAVSILLYLMHGAACVIVNSHLAADILSSARLHSGTVLYGSPFHHAMLAAEDSARAWPTLRLAISTAAALSSSVAEAFLRRYGVPLTQALGIIEVGLPLINLAGALSKPGALGRPLPGFEVDLREGEIYVRGPGMLDAYLRPWRTRATILEDGWFRTGDIGRVDEDGDLWLEGRSSSVINVAGLKCFPEEIEAILREVPGVHLAHVYGRPHPRLGAVPVADLVPRDAQHLPQLAELVAHCRRSLSRYKMPVEFHWVESIELTANGKIRRAGDRAEG